MRNAVRSHVMAAGGSRGGHLLGHRAMREGPPGANTPFVTCIAQVTRKHSARSKHAANDGPQGARAIAERRVTGSQLGARYGSWLDALRRIVLGSVGSRAPAAGAPLEPQPPQPPQDREESCLPAGGVCPDPRGARRAALPGGHTPRAAWGAAGLSRANASERARKPRRPRVAKPAAREVSSPRTPSVRAGTRAVRAQPRRARARQGCEQGHRGPGCVAMRVAGAVEARSGDDRRGRSNEADGRMARVRRAQMPAAAISSRWIQMPVFSRTCAFTLSPLG